jgi:hypothetical protein
MSGSSNRIVFYTEVGAGRLSARICFDIRTALQMGAPEQAADLLVVLRLFIAQMKWPCADSSRLRGAVSR